MEQTDDKGVHPNLLKERSSARFDTVAMTHVIFGGPEKTRRKRFIQSEVIKDPKLQNRVPLACLSREQQYSETLRKAVHMLGKYAELNVESPEDIYYMEDVVFPAMSTPFDLHKSMFIHCLMGQATEEQKAEWLPRAVRYEVIGTYAQTELGHGTFIRGLETTATYDREHKEFVLHSPTLTSLKWWPGCMGKTCNHAVVMAQLHIGEKCYGVHPFLVQIRHLEDHTPMPGVTVGDIGPKLGFETNDNGFLKLEKVRIPREHMLMKHSQVLEDGTYRSSSNDKLVYASMLFIRAMMVEAMGNNLAKACTIAVRYSAVRRQVEIERGQGEEQLLYYQTQQWKLFPQMATALALKIVGRHVRSTYHQVTEQLVQGALDNLPDLHSVTAGLKALSTWAAVKGSLVCQQACGGHGYSEASGFCALLKYTTAACIYEGDNTVMLLQTARYLLKCYQQMQQGRQLTSNVAYLGHDLASPSQLGNDLSLTELVKAYQRRASKLICKSALRFQELITSGKRQSEAWNDISVDSLKAAMAHCQEFIMQVFTSFVLETPMAADLKAVFTDLCKLYAAHGIIENLGEFLESDCLNSLHTDMLRSSIAEILARIRPNAVALVDAFDFSDRSLNSALGRYDGRVYEALYEFAKTSPLNDTEVHNSYFEYLQPLIRKATHSHSKL